MSFESEKRFNDLNHFPRGIRRSGNFTVTESNLLETHGHAMMELYQGKRQPADDVEADFVERVKNGDPAGNPFAKVWLKYTTVIGPRKVHRLCTSSSDEAGSYEPVDESID
jgi:uncharacterized protein YifE (UPF0438 family)